MILIDFTPFQFDFISIQVFKMFFYNKYVKSYGFTSQFVILRKRFGLGT
jgi:hypothetical protein